jgi:cell wall-associated NlpC family hydrolase
MRNFRKTTIATITAMLIMAPTALADEYGGATPGETTPIGSTPTTPTVPGTKAVIKAGIAYAPVAAPDAVKKVIWSGNKIRNLPYVWGGGHGSWLASGYDCSGSVSYALHGAGLLNSPLVSGDLASWGGAGRGSWITIYANGGHVFMTVAGLRFDTSGARPNRWQTAMRSGSGYAVRHPRGL